MEAGDTGSVKIRLVSAESSVIPSVRHVLWQKERYFKHIFLYKGLTEMAPAQIMINNSKNTCSVLRIILNVRYESHGSNAAVTFIQGKIHTW